MFCGDSSCRVSVQFGGVCEHPRPFGTAMPPDKQKSRERVNLFKRIGGVTQKILIRRGPEKSKMARKGWKPGIFDQVPRAVYVEMEKGDNVSTWTETKPTHNGGGGLMTYTGVKIRGIPFQKANHFALFGRYRGSYKEPKTVLESL